MIEYPGKPGSKVKVVNVTEARNQFAKILSDRQSHYVITKNNKPLRVIINNEDFLLLQKLWQGEEGVATQTLAESPQKVPAETKPVKKTSKKLDGLLQKRMQEALIDVEAPEPDPHENEEVISTTKLTSEEGEEDYFGAQNPSLADYDDVSAAHENLEPESGQDLAATDLKLSFEEKEDQERQTKEDFLSQFMSRSPEEQDYYKKYRKLYESLDPKPNTEQEPLISTPRDLGPTKEAFAPPQKQIIREKIPTPKEEPSFFTDDHDKDLPSLQDLLQELEGERLTDEDPGSLGDNEINELINRITSD